MSTLSFDNTEGNRAPERVLLAGPRVSELARFVSERGYEVTRLDSLSDLIATTSDQKPDAVIFEISDASFCPYQTTKNLRALECSPVVLAAAPESLKHRLLRASLAGCEGIIVCPPKETLFFESLQNALKSQRDKRHILELGAQVDALQNAALNALQNESGQLAELQAQLKEANQKNEALLANERAHVTENDALAVLQVRLSESENALEDALAIEKKLRDDLDTAAQAAAIFSAEREQWAIEKEGLRAQRDRNASEEQALLEQSHERERHLKLSEQELKNELANTQKDHAQKEAALRLALESSQQELHEARLAIDELAPKLNELESENKSLRGVVDEGEKQAREARSSFDELAPKLSALESEAKSLRGIVDEGQREIEQLTKSLAKKSEALSKIQDEKASLSDEVSALKVEVTKAQDALKNANPSEALKSENQRLENVALDLEIVNDSLKERIDELTQTLATEKDAAKKERLRLIEEKQEAASGSVDAYQKMEAMVVEMRALKSKLGG